MNLQRRNEDHEDRFVSEYFVKSVVTGALLGGVVFLLFRLLKKKLEEPVRPPIIIKSVGDSDDPIEIETLDILQLLRTASKPAGPSPTSRSIYRTPGFGRITWVRILLKNHGPWGGPPPFKTTGGCELKLWLQYLDGGRWEDADNGPHITFFGASPQDELRLECDALSTEEPTGNPHRPRKRKYNQDERWRIGYVEVVDHGRVNRGDNTKMEIWIDNT
jgi:hypothetical protein